MADLNKILDSVKDKEIDLDKGADIISKVAEKAGKSVSTDTVKGATDKIANSIGDKDGKLTFGDITSTVEKFTKKK